MKPPHPFQRIPHYSGLRRQLRLICYVLPLAPGALPEILARRRRPFRGGHDNAPSLRPNILPPDGHHLRGHPLAGNAAKNEHLPAFPYPHRLPQPPPSPQVQLYDVPSLGPALRRPLGRLRLAHFPSRLVPVKMPRPVPPAPSTRPPLLPPTDQSPAGIIITPAGSSDDTDRSSTLRQAPAGLYHNAAPITSPAAPTLPSAVPSPPAGTPFVTRNCLVNQGAPAHQGPSASAFCRRPGGTA